METLQYLGLKYKTEQVIAAVSEVREDVCK